MAYSIKFIMVYILANTGGVRGFWSYPAFLFRMFSDRRILPLPAGLRYPVALLIALFRAPLAYRKYRKIGGSPLVDIMEIQAAKLERFAGVRVLVGCLYSPPLLESLATLIKDGAVVIPQYPFYSDTTTGSVVDVVRSSFPEGTGVVLRYWMYDEFVLMWTDAIKSVWRGEYLLFVAHGVPERVVLKGDTYYTEVFSGVRLIASALGVDDYRVAFQSRLGYLPWTKPYLEDVMRDLAKEGVKEVVVVPVSFLNEHLETLYDLDVECAELAYSLGFRVYKRVPVPWDSELLLRCWVRAAEGKECVRL